MSKSRRGAVEDCNKISDVIHDTRGITMIENFDITPQEKSQWCYASAIEAVLKYYGIEDTQENIASWYQKKEKPCNVDKSGFNCPQDPGKYIDDTLSSIYDVQHIKYDNTSVRNRILIETELKKGYPIIAFITGHYIIIVGYDDKNYYYYDPMHGTNFVSRDLIYGLRKVSAECLFTKGVPVEYEDQHGAPLIGTSPFLGIITINPKRGRGGKRNTRRRRNKTRTMKKTLRRR